MASVFETTTQEPVQADAPSLDKDKLERYLDRLRLEQNLPLGLLAGLVAALLGAGVWAAVTVLTGYQIGWMAIGVGFLVGFAVRIFGKGLSQSFGVMGAVLALLGCLAGNLAAMYGFGAQELGVPLSQMTPFMTPEIAMDLMVSGFHPMDLLFYALALYAGYRYAFRRLDAREVAAEAA